MLIDDKTIKCKYLKNLISNNQNIMLINSGSISTEEENLKLSNRRKVLIEDKYSQFSTYKEKLISMRISIYHQMKDFY
jgi:hypothetical protein